MTTPVTGPGTSEDGSPTTDQPAGTTGLGHAARQFRDLLLVLTAVLALLVAGTVGYGLAQSGHVTVPGSDSAEAGFARDMSVHHDQAVKMSLLARDRSADPAIRYLALDIATGQIAQEGAMSGWLQQWSLNQTDDSRPRMAWMTAGDNHHGMNGGSAPDGMTGNAVSGTGSMTALLPDGRMPGMAAPAEIEELTRLTGRPAEILWLRLMIRHHTGGIAMARKALARVAPTYEKALAESIVGSQQADIDYMRNLLKARGATP